jgi:hypothetical protein
MLLDQDLERLVANQGPIPAEDQRLAGEVLQVLLAAPDGVGRTELFRLLNPDNIGRVAKSLLDLLGAKLRQASST